jgi:hypothetical protein
MDRTAKIATKMGATATIAAVALIATAAAATAATVNSYGSGFVGKGEVQSAYGLNNGAIQKIITADEKAFTFTSSQSATQSLKSPASQVVTEHATQSAHRVLSCTVTVGGVKNPRVFQGDGTRDGIKTGSREGNRTGDRVGTLDGMLAASIDANARKTGQWTGWNLKGLPSAPLFTATGVEHFEAPEYLAPSFTGGYVFGDVEWSGWQAEPGTNPADCLRSANGAEIDDLSDVTTYGDAVRTTTDYGTESFGRTQVTATNLTGLAQVFVTYNSVTKPLTTTVPVV